MQLEFKIVAGTGFERLLFCFATIVMLLPIRWLIVSKQRLAVGVPMYLAVVGFIGALVAMCTAASDYSKNVLLTLVAASLVPALVLARLLG